MYYINGRSVITFDFKSVISYNDTVIFYDISMTINNEHFRMTFERNICTIIMDVEL